MQKCTRAERALEDTKRKLLEATENRVQVKLEESFTRFEEGNPCLSIDKAHAILEAEEECWDL
jgi:hypothetical protein